MIHPHYAALINLGGNPLVQLIVVLIVAGIIWMIWTNVVMPFLTKVVGEPFLNAINWLVIAILILWVLSVLLDVLFGIRLFGSFG